MRKWKIASGVVVLLFLAAQLIRPPRTNPSSDPAASFGAVVKPPGRAAHVLARSCGDCHSHATVWPWYSAVAPVSWLVAGDVNDGRAHLNLSRWDVYSAEMSRIRIKSMCRNMAEGEMPPKYYTPLHRAARLNEEDVAAVCSLLVAQNLDGFDVRRAKSGQ